MADRSGVLLVQLGGPERREELRPFLYELFADPEILSIPAPFRQLVAFLIAVTRAPKSAETYERIGWSPIRRWSATQARLLEAELLAAGTPAVVRVGMTCSAPDVEAALAELRAAGATRLVVLPLYPQYSVTTTRGSFARVRRRSRRMRWSPERLDAPDAWYRRAALRRRARRPDPRRARDASRLPTRRRPSSSIPPTRSRSPPSRRRRTLIRRRSRRTVKAIDERARHRFRSRLGYQSKVGPVAWLGPSTPDVLGELAKEGVRQVVVVPVAFVSDHVETLFECRLLFGGEAARLGIPHYVVTDGLNDHPEFIHALAAIVTATLGRARRAA